MNKTMQTFIVEQMKAMKNSGKMKPVTETMKNVRRKVLNEDDSSSSDGDKMSNEELKIEALKIATSIAKLMSDVVPDDVVKISEKVAEFIRNHEIGSSESNGENKEKEETSGSTESNTVSDEGLIEPMSNEQ